MSKLLDLLKEAENWYSSKSPDYYPSQIRKLQDALPDNEELWVPIFELARGYIGSLMDSIRYEMKKDKSLTVRVANRIFEADFELSSAYDYHQKFLHMLGYADSEHVEREPLLTQPKLDKMVRRLKK